MKWWRKRGNIIIFIECICLLLMVPGCFKSRQLVFEGSGQDLQIVAQQEDGEHFLSSPMQLSPGVYQLEVRTCVGEAQSMVLNVESAVANRKALQVNSVVVFPGQKEVSFEVYVKHTVPDAMVSCMYQNAGAETLTSVSLYRTSLGNRMLLFIAFWLFVLIDLLVWFCHAIRKGMVSKENQVVVWALTGAVLISFFPYLTDYYNLGADSAFHMLRIEGLKDSLLHADSLPIRVQSYWLYDHGYAVSTFYGDLFLLIPTMLRILGFPLMTAYKIFVLVMNVSTALIAYVSFRSCTKHRYSALFGSLMYMLAPYRIYNIYNRGAVGEYMAMVFLPLVLCGMYHFYMDDPKSISYKKNKYWIILGLTGILQSHLLSTEMIAFFILLVCLVYYRKTFRKETFLQLLQAAGMTLLINMWFWLPLVYQMGNKDYWFHRLTESNLHEWGTWLVGVLQLYPNIGAHQTGMYNAEPIQMGITALIIVVMLCICFLHRWMKRGKVQGETALKKCFCQKSPYDKVILTLLCLVLLAWFMSTRYFPWDALSKVPGIRIFVTALQFPTRLMSPVSAFAAMLGAFFYLWFEEQCSVWKRNHIEKQNSIEKQGCIEKQSILGGHMKEICFSALLFLLVGSAVYHVNDIVYHITPIYLYTAENMGSISVVNGEYLLEGMDKDGICFHDPVAEEGLYYWDYEKSGTTMELTLQNESDRDRNLELPLLGYKGYAVEVLETMSYEEGTSSDGLGGKEGEKKVPEILKMRGVHGDLILSVPAGFEGKIRISYPENTLYKVADMVSLITILAWIAGKGFLWIKNRKKLYIESDMC